MGSDGIWCVATYRAGAPSVGVPGCCWRQKLPCYEQEQSTIFCIATDPSLYSRCQTRSKCCSSGENLVSKTRGMSAFMERNRVDEAWLLKACWRCKYPPLNSNVHSAKSTSKERLPTSSCKVLTQQLMAVQDAAALEGWSSWTSLPAHFPDLRLLPELSSSPV